MKIVLHQGDLPHDHGLNTPFVAVDTETMGLEVHRDRLCLVQLSSGDGVCHLVHIEKNKIPHHLIALLSNQAITKIFHFARFDVGILHQTFNILPSPIYCTKIASKLVRTYTDRHGLKDLCKQLLNVEISKQEQTSDWGQSILTPEQQKYAATDVLHLHKLKEILDGMLIRENRMDLAKAAFTYLPYRACLDVLASSDYEILNY